MENYIEQKGCHRCTWVFVRSDYEEGDTYYCNDHDAGSRPPCMSVAMKECPPDLTSNKEYGEWLERWDTWASRQEVKPWGICDNWKTKA